MMRIAQTLIWIALVNGFAVNFADELPGFKLALTDARTILRDASHLAIRRSDEQRLSYDRTVERIGDVQIRAKDFEGALQSISASQYQYGRDAGLKNLACAVARDGELTAALEILREISDVEEKQVFFEDEVTFHYIDHLITSGDLVGASERISQLKTEWHRPESLRHLATANFNAGMEDLAADQFDLAVDAAVELPDDYARSRAIWEIAEALVSVRKTETAKAIIQRFVEFEKPTDAWAKIAGFTQCGVIAARANDDVLARQLFERAIEIQKEVNPMNKLNAFLRIALAQASAGYFDDALNTGSAIGAGETDDSSHSRREEAISTIAIAQFKSGETETAMRTASLIQYYPQYRDDALQFFTQRQIANQELRMALATAGQIENPSLKATMLLRVAVAHAESGELKNAAAVAARIDLTDFDHPRGPNRFGYQQPRTWGIRYQPSGTSASRRSSIRRAADVAAAAMALSLKLDDQPVTSCATIFTNFDPEVILSIARSHAASGDADSALAWAKQIGMDTNDETEEEIDQFRRLDQRIHALIGVAEGILEKESTQKARLEK